MAKKATETVQAPAETTSKSEAVRRAIAAGKTMPGEGVAYIKETFGIDIAPNHFSSIKSVTGGPQKTTRRPGRPKGSTNKSKSEPVAAVALTAPRVVRSNGGIELEAIQQVKAMVDRLGMATVKQLVDVVA